MRRYWNDARAKVERERRCRICGSPVGLEFAHVIGRVHDQRCESEDGETFLYVDPDDGVPLCRDHHADYDARRLDLLPYLTKREQAAAVRLVGIVRALHRFGADP